MLETSNPSAKHARWWSRVYGRGIKDVKKVYHPGSENSNADALSRHPQLPALVVGIAEDEVQVFPITVGKGKSEVTSSRLEQEVAQVGSQVNSNPVTQFAVHAREYDLPSLPTEREQSGTRLCPKLIQVMGSSQPVTTETLHRQRHTQVIGRTLPPLSQTLYLTIICFRSRASSKKP